MSIYSDSSKSLLREQNNLTKQYFVACGYEKLSVTNTAAALASVPADARYALIVVESSITTPAIRYLELGNKTLPTSAEGLSRSNLDAFDVTGYSNLINFRVIQVAAGTHTIYVQYYR